MRVPAPIILLVFLNFAASADIRYTLWFGDDVDRSYSQTLRVPDESGFEDAMLIAASNDNPYFAFTMNEIAIGDVVLRSLKSIGGVSNDDDL